MRLVSWKSGNATALCVCVMAIAAVHIGVAQEQKPQEVEQSTPAAAQPGSQTTPKPAPKPAEQMTKLLPDPLPGGPNIRVDITIIDQAGADAPVKKTLTVIAADRASGSIRSMVSVAMPNPMPLDTKNISYERLPLNVDVKPEVTRNGHIRVQLILNYETYSAAKAGGMPSARSVVTANQWVMLENGKPMTVSQSADAATDRKVSIELTATILK